MKLKNYSWNGFGFPVIFDEIPAVKINNEWIPDIDWTSIAKDLARFICVHQDVPLSGNQVKFFRLLLGMTLRNFSRFVGVKHPSLLRWESRGDRPAKIESHIEIYLKLRILREIGIPDKHLNKALKQIDDLEFLRKSTYKKFAPLRVPIRDSKVAVFI